MLSFGAVLLETRACRCLCRDLDWAERFGDQKHGRGCGALCSTLLPFVMSPLE